MRHSLLTRYGVAASVTLLSLWLALLLGPLLDPSDFPLFLGAVMVSAWFGGLGPGLLATGLGAVAGVYVAGPLPAVPAGGLGTVVRLGVFLLEALVICSLSMALRSAQERAERLFASEQAARAEAEAAARWLRDIQRVSDAALAHRELDDLLPELLARLREILAADTVVILLLTDDGQALHVRAALGLEEEVRTGVRIPLGRGIAGRIAARREPVLVEDLSAADVASPLLRDRGVQSLLGAPLMVEDRVIGVVHVGTLRPRRFTEAELRLLRLAADRMALAIDHAALYAAERSARAEAETAERRFRLLVDGVRDHAMYMLDRDGRVASWNAGAERMSGHRSEEILGEHFSVFYPEEDVRDGAPARTLDGAAAEGRAESEGWRLRRDGSRFWADVVVTGLRDAGGRLVGFAVITHDLTERRRSAEIRARLLRQAITAREEEQRRLARELHDETGQSLTSLLVGLRALEDAAVLEAVRAEAARLRGVAAHTLGEVRRLARGLRPSALDELGLVPALEHYAAEFSQAHGIAIHVEARGWGGRLAAPVEATLYRIVQEALTNAVKHAKAQVVSVVLQRQPAWVQALVADDGRGFDVEAALSSPGTWAHLGLHGMRERAALLNGSVTIESTVGEGTTIYARIPLAGTDDGEDPGARRG